MQWMANCIPTYANRAAPLREILGKAYEKSGKRTTKSIRRPSFKELDCGIVHQEAFKDLTKQLEEAVEISHRDVEKSIRVYTDA